MAACGRQRCVRICDRCGGLAPPDASISRSTAAQGGSLAGSLAFSMGAVFWLASLVSFHFARDSSAGLGTLIKLLAAGASEVLGVALGPVGAIAGAIGGAVAGSRLGAQALGGIYSIVEANSCVLCEACEAAGMTSARCMVYATRKIRVCCAAEPGFVQKLSDGASSSAAAAAAVAGCAPTHRAPSFRRCCEGIQTQPASCVCRSGCGAD
jgi:hypothetical protein